MTVPRFVHYELRTTDVDSARAFYMDVLGSDFWGRGVSVIPLPEPARARGAPPHWLGHLGVEEVTEAGCRIAAAGGQVLGPTQPGREGSTHAVVRDPFGAVLAVSSGAPATDRAAVSWHVHHGRNEAETFAFYSGLFGWLGGEGLEIGAEPGRLRLFAWEPTGSAVGAMTNFVSPPRIHPQWLFFFRVPDLEAAIAKVRLRRGLVLDPMRTPGGDLVAPCDDPEGAAFGLYQFGDSRL